MPDEQTANQQQQCIRSKAENRQSAPFKHQVRRSKPTKNRTRHLRVAPHQNILHCTITHSNHHQKQKPTALVAQREMQTVGHRERTNTKHRKQRPKRYDWTSLSPYTAVSLIVYGMLNRIRCGMLDCGVVGLVAFVLRGSKGDITKPHHLGVELRCFEIKSENILSCRL